MLMISFLMSRHSLLFCHFCRHWPVGLIHDFLRANKVQTRTSEATTSTPQRSYFASSPSQGLSSPASPSSSSMQAPAHALQSSTPLRITLHLSNPPLDKLFMQQSRESCKANFMSQIKEADFVRWGSVRRITSLRKMDQDALWDGVVNSELKSPLPLSADIAVSPSLTDWFDAYNVQTTFRSFGRLHRNLFLILQQAKVGLTGHLLYFPQLALWTLSKYQMQIRCVLYR